jgi:hypothetical protein
MFLLVIILQTWSWIFNPPNPIPSEFYKLGEGYLIQELDLDAHPQHNPQFAGLSILLSDYGEFRMVSPNDLLEAIKSDSIDINEWTLLVGPTPDISIVDSLGVYHKLAVNYSIGLTKLLQLDDTEIYCIGGKYYVARYIQYAFLDGLPLYYFSPEEELWVNISDLNPRLFLFSLAMLPPTPEIAKYVWKRKYEIPHFWQGNLLRYIRESRH